ncbi:hypothetical protein CMT41_06515 [Colwellia sp. MT41]|uniref:Membrane protein n=1 Tax=Colwellia marinimaniae TaxID=1513592 RepID=A0ABQ0MYT0_9GAMM|nr:MULTISPECIES: OmpA family protein [Colwellia]ALO34410.1 hypothetical protein CMT41_06515 [Colwellia sp. MT41]GAW97417.1 membrane protein [Colwellia marinimaniae]
MLIRPILLLLSTAIAVSACSSSTTLDNKTSLLSEVTYSKSSEKTRMHNYIVSAESRLLALEQQGSKNCILGQLTIAESLLALATQEHNAEMEKDAFITLVELDRQIRKIRCINQYINGHIGCGYTNKSTVLKRWYREADFEQCKNPSMAKSSIDIKHTFITETLHDFDQDKIKPIYYQSLNRLIDLIKNYPSAKLHIIGHTDSKGSTAYNSKLSQKRADNVAKFFTDHGIEASKIIIESQGERSLRELERSDVARVFNRFTSITLVF